MGTTTRPSLLQRARELGPAIAAAADEVEATRRLPPALLDQMHDARLFRMFLPRSVDGEQLHPSDYLCVIEEMARHDASVAWNAFVGNSAALLAPHLAYNTMQTIFGDPRAVVTWGPPNEHMAIAEAGGYRISGRWSFASGCHSATWLGAHCRVRETDGSTRSHPDGRPFILTLLFPAEEAKIEDAWNPIGLRGTASDSYSVDDLFVAEAFTGTRERPDGRQDPGAVFAFPQQSLYAVGVAGVALGIVRAMLEAFAELAAKKSPRGLPRMAESAGVQAGFAKCDARSNAAHAYLRQVLDELMESAPTEGSISIPERARVRLAVTNAIHGAIESADWLYKNAGVDAIFPGSPFERRFRDMHTLSQQIQSRDVHYEMVGAILLGNEPAVFY